MNYYNEFDPKAAAWLRELIRAGHIPAGEVDERSIADVRPDDLRGYRHCHFFAGIGGWAEALRLANWPDDVPVWTGSCPCQPFSVAGKGLGTADERHLWPVFASLIRECRPAIAFGEQVASRAGRSWLAGVRADLEGMGYAVGAADLCAAGVGAPHIRQRLYWVAHSGHESAGRCAVDGEAEGGRSFGDVAGRRDSGGMAIPHGGQCAGLADGQGCERNGQATGREQGNGFAQPCGHSGRLADLPSGGQRIDGGAQRQAGHADQCGTAGGMGDADDQGPQERCERPDQFADAKGRKAAQRPARLSGIYGHWSDFDIIPCRDGKARRVESGSFPLAHGVPARVVRLRGYGNAIVPETAAAFIKAFEEAVILASIDQRGGR